MNLFSLSFLAPVALVGLIALAIPLYLHMRHKPRAEIFKFPAMDFLLKAQRKRKRRFKIEQLWLMLFRMFIIILMAMLFAKPFVEDQLNSQAFKSSKPLLLILDDSVSMLASNDTDRFFNIAKDDIADLLRSRPDSSPTYLLLASKPTALSEIKTAAGLRSELSKLKATSYGVTLDGAYREAMEIIEREKWGQTMVRIISDGSASAWQDIPAEKPENIEVVYSSLREGVERFRNLSITNVVQTPGDTNSVEVSLFNSEAAPVEVSLRIDGDGSAPLNHLMRVEAEGAMAHRFGLTDPLPPKYEVSINNDSFDLDNHYIFSPKSNRSIRLLIVDGDTNPESVRSESFFLQNALGAEESQRYGYDFEVVTPAGITTEKVKASDVICLLNVDVPPMQALAEAERSGKGVLIGMGDRIDFERWNDYLKSHNLEVWEPQTPQAPGIEIRDPGHSLFSPISQVEWESYFQNVGIQAFRLMSVGRSSVQVPLAMGNGSPLLLTKELDRSRLIIWTSSMDLDWTNFPLTFGYVPFIRQIMGHLAGRDSATTYQSFTVNQLRDNNLLETLSLKHVNPAFKSLDIDGPKPGVYTRQNQNHTEFVHVRLDPQELDFRAFSQTESSEEGSALAQAGFRSHSRSDLAPSIQWLLFFLILFETAIAARTSLSWGAR